MEVWTDHGAFIRAVRLRLGVLVVHIGRLTHRRTHSLAELPFEIPSEQKPSTLLTILVRALTLSAHLWSLRGVFISPRFETETHSNLCAYTSRVCALWNNTGVMYQTCSFFLFWRQIYWGEPCRRPAASTQPPAAGNYACLVRDDILSSKSKLWPCLSFNNRWSREIRTYPLV